MLLFGVLGACSDATWQLDAARSRVGEATEFDTGGSDASAIPVDWIGHSLSVAPPTIEYIGQAGLSEDGPDHASQLGSGTMEFGDSGEDGEAQLDVYDPDVLVWIEVNAASGNMYRMSIPRADALAIHTWMEEQGFTSPRGPGGEPLPPRVGPVPEEAPIAVSFGGALEPEDLGPMPSQALTTGAPPGQHTWSDGDDSRARMTVADGFSLNHWPFRTIAHMDAGNGCTGTIIGEKVLLTAAHCVWNQDNEELIQHNIRARRDPSLASPYGTTSIARYWMPSQFENDSCGDSEACNKYDIAAVELNTDIGDTTGGMGFASCSTTSTQASTNYMRGYPSCASGLLWSPSRPSPCTAFALYGSTQECEADYFQSGACWGDGWYCEMLATCDGSPGQSGAAMYTYDIPSFNGNPGAIAVYSEYECVDPWCDGSTHPNRFTRITPDVAYLISLSKSIWGSW